LEERVRTLESEIKELKALLDEKDENIDVLSRIHSNSSQYRQVQRRSLSASSAGQEAGEQEKDESFKIMQPPTLLENENSDTYFMGMSSGGSLIGISVATPVLTSYPNSCRCFPKQIPGDGAVDLKH